QHSRHPGRDSFSASRRDESPGFPSTPTPSTFSRAIRLLTNSIPLRADDGGRGLRRGLHDHWVPERRDLRNPSGYGDLVVRDSVVSGSGADGSRDEESGGSGTGSSAHTPTHTKCLAVPHRDTS